MRDKNHSKGSASAPVIRGHAEGFDLWCLTRSWLVDLPTGPVAGSVIDALAIACPLG